ncbi:phage tail assembly chaperone [Aureimonas populi]|uniref:Tail assembly chaperone n=1 Tax=Aureimonas populi TaxID=1701758 RepID=A0ABW5CH49_9HYPH|nr:hypothetical protein [Aureimonas populi]
MDIAGLYDYEQTFALHLVNPTTEEELGIVFQIRSAESDEAKKVQREQIDDMLERQQRGKLIKGEQAINRELEKAVSYIASWDWGERRQRDARFGRSHPEVKWPVIGSHLLEWFWELSAARRQGMNGPDPIAFADIAAWVRLTGTIIRRDELTILRQMDAAYRSAVSEEHADARRRSEARSKAQAAAKAMVGR